MKYYLVGIKGTGMSALASMLYDCGNEIIGSDVLSNFGFEQGLKERNIQILNFKKENITSDYIYIISNAYHDDNVEVKEIQKHNYQYFYYHEFISKLNGIHIAISGTHGKTTTSFFIKQLLRDEKIAYIIGDGSGGGCIDYTYLIYEACECQDHFLVYNPDILVITNIDYDHPDYFNSLDDVKRSFEILKKKSKFVIELDNYEILEITSDYTKFIFQNDVYLVNLIGKHLIDDLVLAITVLKKLGYDYEYIKNRFNYLQMPKRRMEETIIQNTVIIEDYGHHPKEIKALYESIKLKYSQFNKICIFQPHTYSRTLRFYKEFIDALSLFDDIYVDDVFTSKREPCDIEKQNIINYLFNCFKTYSEFNVLKCDFNKKQVIVLLGAGDLNIRFMENIK